MVFKKSVSHQPSQVQYQNKPIKRLSSWKFRSLVSKKQRQDFIDKSKKFLPEDEKPLNPLKLFPSKMAVSAIVSRKLCMDSFSMYQHEQLPSQVGVKRNSVKSLCKERHEDPSKISVAYNKSSHLFNNCSSGVTRSICSPPWDNLFESYEILASGNSGSPCDSAHSKNSKLHHVQKNQQKCISFKNVSTNGNSNHLDNENKFENSIRNEQHNSNFVNTSLTPIKAFKNLSSNVLRSETFVVNNAIERSTLDTVNIKSKKIGFKACDMKSEDFIQTKKLKYITRPCNNQSVSSMRSFNCNNHEKQRKIESEFVLDVSKHYFHDNRMNLSALELFSLPNVCSAEHLNSDSVSENIRVDNPEINCSDGLSGSFIYQCNFKTCRNWKKDSNFDDLCSNDDINDDNIGLDYNDNKFICNEGGFKKYNKIRCCNNTKIYYSSSKSTSEDYLSSSSDEDKNEKEMTNLSVHSEGVEVEERGTNVEE